MSSFRFNFILLAMIIASNFNNGLANPAAPTLSSHTTSLSSSKGSCSAVKDILIARGISANDQKEVETGKNDF